MTDDIASFELPPVVRAEDCKNLHDFLCVHADQSVQLDGMRVEKLSGLAAQVMIAHQKFRLGTDLPLSVRNPSSAFRHTLTTLGLAEALGVTP